MVDHPVLVLNQSYEPLNVCRARRAIVLVFCGKAEMLENGVGWVHTASADFPLPSVIRLMQMVKRPFPVAKLTRAEIFARDNYTCQYCGKQTHELTIDHVVPRHAGGPHTWENVVSACPYCNHKKAGRTPEQARMKLLSKPVQPRGTSFTIPYRYRQNQVQWKKYLFQ